MGASAGIDYRNLPAPPGMVWDAAQGGFVSQAVQQQRAAQTASAKAAGDIATGTAAGTYHAPMSQAEMAQSELAAQHERDLMAQNAAQNALATRAQTASETQSQAERDLATRQQAFTESQALARQQALAAIAAQIQTSTGYSPGNAPAPAPTSPTDLAAENAGYGRAKERTGLAMQSALKGLRGAMASRGISGSGIEATGTASVYGGGVGALAETDRQMAEQGAGRAFTANQSALDRAEQARQANMQNQSQRLAQLVSLYGSAY